MIRMRVRKKSDQREGQSTTFNKWATEALFVDFGGGEGQEESVPINDLEVWLDRPSKFMDFKTALKNRAILVSGGPAQFVEP